MERRIEIKVLQNRTIEGPMPEGGPWINDGQLEPGVHTISLHEDGSWRDVKDGRRALRPFRFRVGEKVFHRYAPAKILDAEIRHDQEAYLVEHGHGAPLWVSIEGNTLTKNRTSSGDTVVHQDGTRGKVVGSYGGLRPGGKTKGVSPRAGVVVIPEGEDEPVIWRLDELRRPSKEG